jgi:hypothetical protein
MDDDYEINYESNFGENFETSKPKKSEGDPLKLISH